MSKLREIIDSINEDTKASDLVMNLVEVSEEIEEKEKTISELNTKLFNAEMKINELKEVNYDLMKKCIDKSNIEKDEPIKKEIETSFDDVINAFESEV